MKYALRQLLKNPGFTAVAVLTLALGIGVNTTVFSWASAVLFRPLRGVDQPERMVALATVKPDGGPIDSSYLDYRDYRDQAQSLAGVIAFQDRPLSFGDDNQTERVWSQLVSGNYFDVLAIRPLAGRFYSAEEQAEAPGKHPVVVISAGFWEKRFNANTDIIGKTIRLNRQEFTVIGVAPKNFPGTVVGLSFDVWVPLMMQDALTRGGDWLHERQSRPLHSMARLKPGVSLSEARTEVQSIAQRLAKSYPASNEGISATLLSIEEAPYGAQSRLSSLIETLLGVGAIVLLIVCANVANLLLARAATRQREFGIRMALGASRGQILRQLLLESLLLACLGGAAGALLAGVAKDFFNVFIPATHLPVSLEFPIDGSVLGFTLLISCSAGLIFGLAPAIQTIRGCQVEHLRAGDRSATASARPHRLRGMLVVAEVALALVALIGASLFFRSLQHARRMDPGFNFSNVLLASLNLSEQGYTREQGMLFLRQARERIEALPGVRQVSYAEDVPLGFDTGSWEDVRVDGYVPQTGENMKIYRNLVAPRYFELMGIGLLDGREFTDRDDAQALEVVIVTEAFVRRFLAGQQPIGRKMRAQGRERTIVGVAKDIKYQSLGESPEPYFYLPLEQVYDTDVGLAIHIRTAGPPETLLSGVRRELASLDSSVQIFEALSLSDYIGAAWFPQRVAATLLGVLGSLALVLAALGLFSVMAYTVSQRTREIGVRMALGARSVDVVRLVASQGFKLTGMGIAVGLALSCGLTPLIASQLLGIRAIDPLTFTWVSLMLVLVALSACWIPARRAARVDPIEALRQE